jgi:DMSO/TMAO reductase YedYZ molybdopterin-dependent catalytic subunit
VDVTPEFSREELQLATRNHGMPLEALRYPITPVGLHYLLIHFDIPVVDASDWRLEIGGRVKRPLSLSLDEIRSLPSTTLAVTFECAGNGRALLDPRPISQPWLREAVGTGQWTGASLRSLLERAGLEDEAMEVLFTGLDRGVEGEVEQFYERSLPLAESLREEVLLAYDLNGRPLPPQHGFPLRLVVPGWYGMTNVKWLAGITVLAESFAGYQQARSYRFRQEEDETGEPVSRMMPRALMAPPGIPEFLARTRVMPLASCTLEGRAWSGWGPITRVEVSTDGGERWREAKLDEPPSPYAWRGWWIDWTPPGPGTYELCCRAEDEAGHRQPTDASWNLGGYANTAVQRITVAVREG